MFEPVTISWWLLFRRDTLSSVCVKSGSLRTHSSVPARVVIFDIRALWRSGLSIRVPGCQKLQMTA